MAGGGTFHVEIDITPWWTDRQVGFHRYYLIPSCPGLDLNQVKRYEMQPRRGDDVLGKKSPFACMF